MNYWLIKSEPENYSWDQLVKDKSTSWTGVRNYAARNNLQAMKKGDLLLYYHSMGENQIVGIAKVIKEWYEDPTADDGTWKTVDVAPVKALKKPVTLAEVKKQAALQQMDLVRISRLSVGKVSSKEFEIICKMAETTL